LIYQGRGTALMSKGRMDEAIADFSAALDRDPKIVWAYFNRGLALLVKGDDVRAQADFDRCLALRPDLKAELDRRAELARSLGAKK